MRTRCWKMDKVELRGGLARGGERFGERSCDVVHLPKNRCKLAAAWTTS
jgi:hypothetical protein